MFVPLCTPRVPLCPYPKAVDGSTFAAVQIYKLSHGVEGVGAIEGTAAELQALLDGYPVTITLEVLAMEKIAASDVYPVLLRYSARRLVDHLED
jgi:hypothetical protein